MLQLVNQTTMSSREIAKLINKEHTNIKISAERLAEKGVILTLALQEFQHNGNTYTEYLLNKRDSLILVAQNCPEFTAIIVDRWQELENQQAPKLPSTYLEALENLVIVEKERARLQSVNNALMHVSKLYTSTEIGKELGMRSGSQLNTALKEKQIQYKTGGTWVLYAGYSEMRLISIKQDISPSGHTYYDRRWTQLGREFILALFGVK